MNILIIGSGAVGIGIGTSLISQNANVDFYATEKTAKIMKENGIKRCGIFNEINISNDKFNVYTKYSTIPKNMYDFIIICSKITANKDIAQNLNKNKAIFKKDTKILILQNGFGNDEFYLEYFNKDQVYCGRVITGFRRPEKNISEIMVHTAPILLGSLQGQDVTCLKSIAKLINDSGIESETTNELNMYLWAKMLFNCALNPLGAILRVNYGKLSENEFSIEIMNNIIDEIFEVLKMANYKVQWDNSDEYKDFFYSKLIPDTYNHKSSTLQDIEKKQITEIDALNGKVIEIASKYNVNVETNKIIYNMIKAIENEF